MIEKIKDKTLEEIKDEFVLTDHVIFENFIEKFKTYCRRDISRAGSKNKKPINIVVSEDVAHILKYYSDDFDYSDAENKPINYVGRLPLSESNPDFPSVEIYTKITEDEVLIMKNQADPVMVSYGVEAPEVKLKAEYSSETIARELEEARQKISNKVE